MTTFQRYVRTYEIRPLVSKPGKSSYPLLREKRFERLTRAPECTDCAETWTNASGRASCARSFIVLPKSVLYKEKSCQQYENLTNIRIHIDMNNRHDHSKRFYMAPEGEPEIWDSHCRLSFQIGICWARRLDLAFSPTPWPVALPGYCRAFSRARRRRGRETAKRGRTKLHLSSKAFLRSCHTTVRPSQQIRITLTAATHEQDQQHPRQHQQQ